MSSGRGDFDFNQFIGASQIVICVPPFLRTDLPSLGPHALSAAAKDAGLESAVLYLNLHFAEFIGASRYDAICRAPRSWLLGERIFAAAAFGCAPLGYHQSFLRDLKSAQDSDEWPIELGYAFILECALEAEDWIRKVGIALGKRALDVFAITCSFEQISCGYAILRKIKEHTPTTVTFIGGANCERELARGIGSVFDVADYIISGKAEETFVDVLRTLKSEYPAPRGIHEGRSQVDLNKLQTPTFSEYFKQRNEFLRSVDDDRQSWILYESSRGCWWGEKHHCTFCGISEVSMPFREKSSERVLEELEVLTRLHPGAKIRAVDDIMPHSYFRTLLPLLAQRDLGVEIFYEQKANLTFDKAELLYRAGVKTVQPGIESLSTPILRRMRKGITGSQNILALRALISAGILPAWQLLYGLPGDEANEYRDLIHILPSLHHLPPPGSCSPINLLRFSPYVDQPQQYGIRDVRPLAGYSEIFPKHADIENLAYFFEGEFESAAFSEPNLVFELKEHVARWQFEWRERVPMLEVVRIRQELYLLQDTRGLPNLKRQELISPQQALAALVVLPSAAVGEEEFVWAVDRHAALKMDGAVVPLATTSPQLMRELLQSPVKRSTRVGAAL